MIAKEVVGGGTRGSNKLAGQWDQRGCDGSTFSTLLVPPPAGHEDIQILVLRGVNEDSERTTASYHSWPSLARR